MANKTILGNLNKNRWLVPLIVVLAIFTVIGISPFGSPIVRMVKSIQCGRNPVETSGGILGSVRYYADAGTTSQLGYKTYFCTPLEAEKAGYSANQNSYEFPNLRAER